jgi:hypothetical protein
MTTTMVNDDQKERKRRKKELEYEIFPYHHLPHFGDICLMCVKL